MDYKYEVAISCLMQDVNIAQELYELLQSRVRSNFFFPHNQEDWSLATVSKLSEEYSDASLGSW